MRPFACRHCGQPLYFENVRCLSCGYQVGFAPDQGSMVALEPATEGATSFRAVGHGRDYRFCANAAEDVCNWLIPAESSHRLCEACRHNRMLPNLSVTGNHARWAKLETAKRYLFYSLIRLGLPRTTRTDDPKEGLAFDFLEDVVRDGDVQRILTGHDSGLITINVAEADDPEREKRRASMGERYRTLLGHFRHEVGHWYWDRLIRDNPPALERFRAVFGDDRQDYARSLQEHYRNGAPADWEDHFVSAYATTHAWEDWAETWAHYLHIVDTLETAGSFGLHVRPQNGSGNSHVTASFDPYGFVPIEELIRAWLPLIFAMNSVCRSMGENDLYPFVISPPVVEKLGFINDLVHLRTPGLRQAA